MASNEVLAAVQNELARLRQVEVEKLAEAVAMSESFYGEGDIPLPEKKK